MKKTAILALAFSFSFWACQKDSVTVSEYDLAMSKVKFECTGIKDSIFFQANMGNSQVCMSSDKIAAKASAGVNLNLNYFAVYFYSTRGDISYQPIIKLEGPKVKSGFKAYEICDLQLKQGVSNPIRGFSENDSTNFNVIFEVDEVPKVKLESGTIYTATSSAGIQLRTAAIIFDEVIRTESINSVHYDVKGHFNCKLYKYVGAPKVEFFNDLSDAQFKFSIDAAK